MIDVEHLRTELTYDADTGAIFRKNGKAAFFTRDTHGYLQGRLSGKLLLAHRVAWALHHGAWPASQIDHINGIRTDNRIENLRVVSGTDNARNAKTRKDSTSGVAGVGWHPRHNKWMVRIGFEGRQKTIGYFEDLVEAKAARKAAEKDFGYHPNHGRLQ